MSKILFAVYVVLFTLYVGLHFSFTLVLIFTVPLSIFMAACTISILIIDLIKGHDYKKSLTVSALFTIPLLILFIITQFPSSKNEILCGYSDGVISGAEIQFFEEDKMMYSSISLFATQRYHGEYTTRGDTFFIHYLSNAPLLSYTKILNTEKEILFLDSLNNEKYTFYKY